MKIVPGSIEVCRHHRYKLGAVLPVVGLAHLDPRDLGDGVGFVGRFQGAGQEVFLLHGLRGVFGVDAGGAQEEEAVYAGEVGVMDDVGLDDQIVVDELGRVGVVGVDAADLGCGQEDVVGALAFEEGADGLLVHEVQAFQAHAALGLGAEVRGGAVDGAEDVFVALFEQGADQGAADHAGGSGYEDFVCRFHFVVFVHAWCFVGWWCCPCGEDNSAGSVLWRKVAFVEICLFGYRRRSDKAYGFSGDERHGFPPSRE